MLETVRVSSTENRQHLQQYVEDLFRRGHYSEITQAIGIHSILIDPQFTLRDQTNLYRSVLNMLKDRLSKAKGKQYSAWYAEFPRLMDQLAASGQIIVDKAASDILASRRAAFGMFASLDDFFFWALDDRRFTLDQIITYIDKTAAMQPA